MEHHQLFLTLQAHIGSLNNNICNVALDKVRVEGKEGVVKEESKFIKFSLGICADGSQETSDVNIKDSKVIPVITINQLQKLHQQVNIFNYISAVVAVPSKLVVPIWKRVANSVFSGIPSNFSSSKSSEEAKVAEVSNTIYKNLDEVQPVEHIQVITYKSFMDPEPGRCRRTDGNKWRCRKDVVPDTKYCERHMHRGRSRKHVETSKVTLLCNAPMIMHSSSNTPTTTCSSNTSEKIKSHDPDDTSAKDPTPVPNNQQTKIPALDEGKVLTCIATAMITSSANGKSKVTSEFVLNDISSRDNIRDTNNKGNSTNGDKNGGPVIPEPSISAMSGVNVVTIGSNKVCKNRDAIAEEPQRCRRTDGKRWRCSKEAIPQQKYCGSHMHRGSKRCRSSSEVENVTATPAVLDKLKGHLSTDLSISPLKCTQPAVINIDSSTSVSSSNATTVTDTDTDENTSASHVLSLSP